MTDRKVTVNEAAESWFAGRRLPDDSARVVQAVWLADGVRLGLNYGDCVAICRTAMQADIRKETT